jgi:hypothetical protein
VGEQGLVLFVFWTRFGQKNCQAREEHLIGLLLGFLRCNAGLDWKMKCR